LEVGGILIEEVEAAVSELVAHLVPSPLLELVGGVLDEHRHQVLAGRRNCGIDGRRDRAFKNRILRRHAVFGVVVGSLDEVEIGHKMHRAAMLWAYFGTWKGREVRKLG